MNEMEMKARENHRDGNNCSASLAMAFAEKLGMSEAEAKSFVPAPRSIDGKCGGYLSVVAMLEKPVDSFLRNRACSGKLHYWLHSLHYYSRNTFWKTVL